MKKSFLYLIFFFQNFLNANCDILKNIVNADKIVRFNYERNPEKGWNNFGIDVGFRVYNEYQYIRSENNLYCTLGLHSYSIRNMDYFHLGFNLKTNLDNKTEPSINCKLLDLNWHENTEFSDDLINMFLKIYNVNSDVYMIDILIGFK